VNISIGMSDGYIVGEALVRYVSDPDGGGSSLVGAEFLYLPPDSLKLLRRLVERRRSTGLF
jgi:hypothetical protein